jgi:hypothetical protein
MSDKNYTDNEGGRFLSVDCVDFWFDAPADYTVRPMSPDRIQQAKAFLDEIRAAEAIKRQPPPEGPTS